MINYIMKNGSNKLRAIICKLITKGFDIEDYKTMVNVGLISENVDYKTIKEYERLYSNYNMR